ncbi:hypothetical protein [Umezawaea sp.]|uniref:hypothetical protein n=1 Tax=Umezawaea sp. TaxID=1955258 RepID=UPI002ED28FA0
MGTDDTTDAAVDPDPVTAEDSSDEERKDEDDEGFSAAQTKASDPDSAHEWNALRDMLHTAKQMLGGVGGTANFFFRETSVGQVGDNYATGNSSHVGMVVDSGPVPSTTLARIRESYVEPARYSALRRALQSHQVVVIHARGGTGRTTTALRLLDELCREGVLKLDPDVNLKTLDGQNFKGLHGYLLESLDPDQARDLRSFHTERLSRLMRDTGCMLVVIAEDSTELPVADIGHLVVDDLGGVEPAELIRRHLSWGMAVSGAGGTGLAVLEDPEVEEIVAELTDDVPRRELAHLGSLLVDVAAGRIDVATVRERYSRTSRANFLDWFNQQTDVEQRAFMISLAVFNDESVQLVSQAATMLADRIRRIERRRPGERGRALFATPLGKRLEDARAEVVESLEDTAFGPIAVRKVRFRNDNYPAWVLEHLCTEYDQGMEVVEDWLRGLGGALGERVRVRTGMAVGFLSLFDFIGIHNRVVLPWAESDDPAMRDSAVAALQLPAEHPALGRVVHRMLDRWLKDRGSWSRRKTAARAIGTTTSASPGTVLRLLKRTARHADWPTAFAISESVSDVFCRVDDPVQVLTALVAWSDDDEFPNRRNTALLAVLVVGNYLTVTVPESSVKWPALLWLAEEHPEHRERIVVLFARIIETAGFLRRGYGLLRDWVRLAQRDNTLRAPLARLLRDIAVEADDVDSVRYELEHWASRPGGPVDAVRAVVDHFDQEGP